MLPLTVGFVDQMLNLSKNGIKLLNTHSIVGIEPVWIFSQIFIQSVKLTKILTCFIYRVYPILSIVFFPSTMVYIYRNVSKCYNNLAEFTRSVQPLKYISIYAYLLSNNGKMVKQTAVQLVSTWKIALQNKNRAIKRGL